MSYKDKIEGTQVISDGPLAGLYGMAMFGETWGEVAGVELTQSAEVTEIKVGKKLVAVEISGGKHTLALTIKINKDSDPPGIGDLIKFPLEAMQGRITSEAKLVFADSDFATYTCTATSWHDFTSNDGGGKLTTDITSSASALGTISKGTESSPSA